MGKLMQITQLRLPEKQVNLQIHEYLEEELQTDMSRLELIWTRYSEVNNRTDHEVVLEIWWTNCMKECRSYNGTDWTFDNEPNNTMGRNGITWF